MQVNGRFVCRKRALIRRKHGELPVGLSLRRSDGFGDTKSTDHRPGCVQMISTKNEMTLDCFIFRSSSFFTNSDHPQSRVISAHSWYLTSFFVPRISTDLTWLSSSSVFLFLYHDPMRSTLSEEPFALSVKAYFKIFCFGLGCFLFTL